MLKIESAAVNADIEDDYELSVSDIETLIKFPTTSPRCILCPLSVKRPYFPFCGQNWQEHLFSQLCTD